MKKCAAYRGASPRVVSCPSVLQHVAYGSVDVEPRLLLFDVRRSVNRSDIEKQLQGFAVERLVRFVSTGGSRPHVTPPSASRAPSVPTCASVALRICSEHNSIMAFE